MFALTAIGRVEGLLDYNRLYSDASRYAVFSLLCFLSLIIHFIPAACFSGRIGIILRTTDNDAFTITIQASLLSVFYILMLMEYPSLPPPDQNLGVMLGNDSRFVKRLVYTVAVWSAKEPVAKLDGLSKNLECR